MLPLNAAGIKRGRCEAQIIMKLNQPIRLNIPSARAPKLLVVNIHLDFNAKTLDKIHDEHIIRACPFSQQGYQACIGVKREEDVVPCSSVEHDPAGTVEHVCLDCIKTGFVFICWGSSHEKQLRTVEWNETLGMGKMALHLGDADRSFSQHQESNIGFAIDLTCHGFIPKLNALFLDIGFSQRRPDQLSACREIIGRDRDWRDSQYFHPWSPESGLFSYESPPQLLGKIIL